MTNRPLSLPRIPTKGGPGVTRPGNTQSSGRIVTEATARSGAAPLSGPFVNEGSHAPVTLNVPQVPGSYEGLVAYDNMGRK